MTEPSTAMPKRRSPWALPRVRTTGAVALLATVALAAPAAATGDLCAGHRGAHQFCSLGKGRKTAGGGDKASHAGWPAVTGIHWSVNTGTTGETGTGTPLNDELLGSHGGDTLQGGAGNDILWGDQLPNGNDTWQHDVFDGGPGNDWIYTSHGNNTVDAGPGSDHIFVHFGRGTVDCGAGNDFVEHVTRHTKFTFHNCEHILHQ